MSPPVDVVFEKISSGLKKLNRKNIIKVKIVILITFSLFFLRKFKDLIIIPYFFFLNWKYTKIIIKIINDVINKF